MARLSRLLLLLIVALPVTAIVTRHDRDEARFRELAATVPPVVDMNLPGGAGCLIAPRWVLTAAHVAALMKSDHSLRIGGQTVGVARIVSYPGGREGRDDLALIELVTEVTAIDPVPIYRDRDEEGAVIVFAGRGMSGDGREGPVRRDAVLRAATNEVDRAGVTMLVFDFDAPPDGTDLEGISGGGDSGGPAYLTKAGVTFVAGVSSGQDSRKTGKEGVYGVTEYYVRVSSYIDWIGSVMSESAVIRMHGIEIADPDQWLEDLSSPETAAWLRRQAAKTDAALPPATIEELERQILAATPKRRTWPPVRSGRNLLLLESAITGGSATSEAELFILGPDGSRELFLATKTMFPGGDYELQRHFSPSPDGRYLAFSFARPSSRWLHWRFINLASREILPETLYGAHTSGSTIAWSGDSRQIVYGRFPIPEAGSEISTPVRDQRLYLHRLGSAQSEDRVIHGQGRESDRWFIPYADGKNLVIVSGRGTAEEMEVLSMPFDGSGKPILLNHEYPGTFTWLGSTGGSRYFLTNAGAPRWKIVRHRGRTWTTVVEEQEHPISHAALAGGRLLIARNEHAQPVFSVATLDGQTTKPLALPSGNVWGGSWGPGFTGKPDDERAYFIVSSLTDPGSVHWLEPRTMKTGALSSGPEHPARAVVLRHVRYPSADGTMIPMAIAHRPGLKLDGSQRVIMYGYGALGWSAYPWFQPQMVAWLDRGGVFALPGIRGGGEYGEAWHRAGIGRNRENAVTDYVAAAEWLIAQKYTSARGLVASTSSIGSAVVATALARRPELFGAALIDIPVIDLLRYDRHTGGAMWAAELGDPKDPEDSRVLRAMSPIYDTRSPRCAPPTLVTAGSRDETAVPSHAYKYVAALQRAQRCESPILLQVVEGAGHSYGSSAEQSARTWAAQLAFIDKHGAGEQPGGRRPE